MLRYRHMSEKKRTQKRVKFLGIPIDLWLWAKLQEMRKINNNVSLNFLVRRALTAMVLSGKVPWPSDDETARIEREKWGQDVAPVPTLDVVEEEDEAEEQRPIGREEPVRPSQ